MKIGIDLGGSHIAVGLVDGSNVVLKKDKLFTERDKENPKLVIIDTITLMINELLKEHSLKIGDISSIGIASPGIINGGTIIKATNLRVENFSICEEIEKVFNIKTSIRNDGKCAGLAEKEYGSLKGYKDACFLCIGTGIGGSIFVDGKPLLLKNGEAFEIGHMVIEKDGLNCSCGKKGCFECYASIRALKKAVTDALGIKDDISGKYLRDNLLTLDDKRIRNTVNNYLDYLKIGIGNIIDIFGPEAIALGGSFSHYEDVGLLDGLIKKMHESDATFTDSKSTKIMMAEFKNDAGIIGATL